MNHFQVNGHTKKREGERELAHKIPTNAKNNQGVIPHKEKQT